MCLLSDIAALLTRMSIRPNFCTTSLTSVSTSASDDNVGDERRRLAVASHDLARDLVGAALVVVHHRDLGAFGREQLCGVLADVAAGAGDDRDLIL